jgi:hypothetical protein
MRLPILFLSLLVCVTARAEWGDFEYDFDADKKPWQEVQAQLPAYPKAEQLIPFEVSSSTRHKHFIDGASLSAGEDGVVRYTVVVKTEGGAENVSFEGLRCATGERKLYAFGRADGQGGGSWSRNRYARWELIQARLASSYQRELFFHYFCTVDGAGDMKVMRDALRRGGIRRGE